MKVSNVNIAKLLLLITVACAKNVETPPPVQNTGCWFTFKDVKYTLSFVDCYRAVVINSGGEYLGANPGHDFNDTDTVLQIGTPGTTPFNGDYDGFIRFRTIAAGQWDDDGNAYRFINIKTSGKYFIWTFIDSLKGPADPITLKNQPLGYISGDCKCVPK